jgi:hypothetical protein
LTLIAVIWPYFGLTGITGRAVEAIGVAVHLTGEEMPVHVGLLGLRQVGLREALARAIASPAPRRVRIQLAGQIPASTLLRCWKVRIVLFAHRLIDLPGCRVAVMFNHPFAWVADRDRPAATSVLDRAANFCHLADTTGVNLAAT